jgi:hypothetical protein
MAVKAPSLLVFLTLFLTVLTFVLPRLRLVIGFINLSILSLTKVRFSAIHCNKEWDRGNPAGTGLKARERSLCFDPIQTVMNRTQ